MLALRGISKEYPSPAGPLRVLNGLSLDLAPRSTASIMGPSGCGKSTLLSILGGLEAPTSGDYTLNGANPYTLSLDALARFRNSSIGFVFQDHCLLPQLTVLENVLAPTLASAATPGADDRARHLLHQVGLRARLDHFPAQLSGGEKQRAAIARALILDPPLVLCDEPTGNLDHASAASVADLLLSLAASGERIVITVTHSAELAARFALHFSLQEGALQAA